MQYGKQPFLRLLSPLCIGIVLSEYYSYSILPGIICLFISVALAILSCLKRENHRALLPGLALILFFTAAGFLLYYQNMNRCPALENKEQQFEVEADCFPERREHSFRFSCSIRSDSLRQRPDGKLLVYYLSDSLNEQITPGDHLIVRITPVEIKNNGNPCEFNYARYMRGRGIRYYGFIKPGDIEKQIQPVRRGLTDYSAIVADNMIRSFSRSGLEGDELAVITALTIGNKEMLDKEQLSFFSKAGVMHIMAVSGLHVGMISLFLSSLLFFFKRRWIIVRIIIIIIALWAFAFITGLSPSVMRATIMFSFLQGGKLLRRESNSLNILLASAFIMLVARPSMLFEAGFQLSYLAVLSILLFYKPLFLSLKIKNKPGKYLWQLIAVSLTAQTGTLPLTISLFNSFPLLFLVSNIIIVPLTFAIIVLALMLFPASHCETIAHVLAWALSKLAYITLCCISFISNLPFSSMSDVGLTTIETILLSISLFLLMSSLLRVRRITLMPFIVVFTLFFTTGIIKDIREERMRCVIIYNIRGDPVTALQSGRYLCIVSSVEEVPVEIKRHAATLRLHVRIIPSDGVATQIHFNGTETDLFNSQFILSLYNPAADIIISNSQNDHDWLMDVKPERKQLLVVPSLKRRFTGKYLSTHTIKENGSLIIKSKN